MHFTVPGDGDYRPMNPKQQVGILVIQITVWVFILGAAFVLIIGTIVDLWRIWYGLITIVIAIGTALIVFENGITRPRLFGYSGILPLALSPYGIAELLLILGHAQFLDDGIGIWKCQGEIDWFWNSLERCNAIREQLNQSAP
jgi:hypothetical protein